MAALATIGPALAIGSAVVGAGASAFSAYSTYQQGQAQQAQAEQVAQQDMLAGKNEFAASQREAELRKQEGNLIMSTQRAYAAASGGGSGADDPTITKILTDTGAKTQFGADSYMYQGQQREDDYFANASATRQTGANNFMGATLSALGTLAGGIGRFAGAAAGFVPQSTSRTLPALVP